MTEIFQIPLQPLLNTFRKAAIEVTKFESVQKAYDGTLKDILDCNVLKEMKVKQGLKVCLDVVLSLEKMHTKFLHCDIRLENIFIEQMHDLSRRGRLADFELACSIRSPTTLSAPYEFWDSAKQKSGRTTPFTDIFGLGVALGEIIWGNRFFTIICDERDSYLTSFTRLVATTLSVRSGQILQNVPRYHPRNNFYLTAYDFIDALFKEDRARAQGQNIDKYLTLADVRATLHKLSEIIEGVVTL